MRVEVCDGSQNLIAGFDGAEALASATRLVEWLMHRRDALPHDVLMFGFESDGAPVLLYPSEPI